MCPTLQNLFKIQILKTGVYVKTSEQGKCSLHRDIITKGTFVIYDTDGRAAQFITYYIVYTTRCDLTIFI